ncbi:helix-turn-helix domain-containing protein [Ruminococcaceae bacterium OttesenSCG-928-I18]|nr:helix-turn-helix domain-containing protein [Ruminococcaceae bacterium OttesenSCG-928-I18]
MAFYDNYERLCRSINKTPTEVGRENDIQQGTISMWKKRGSTPSATTVSKLAKYFHVSEFFLLTGQTEQEFNNKVDAASNKELDDEAASETEITDDQILKIALQDGIPLEVAQSEPYKKRVREEHARFNADQEQILAEAKGLLALSQRGDMGARRNLFRLLFGAGRELSDDEIDDMIAMFNAKVERNKKKDTPDND